MRRFLTLVLVLAALATGAAAQQQPDWIRTGTNLGAQMRLAVADFKGMTAEGDSAGLLRTFNDTLYSDLQYAGIFDVVSKSFNPMAQPGAPAEVNLGAWANPPTGATMLAFGNLGVSQGSLAVQAWLYDVTNAQNPQVLGKQYRETASPEMARAIAHRFANEIIFRLGGGIPGIAESNIVFISTRGGNKEVWMMDYDGQNQRQLTRQRSIALSPRISPDGSRVAYTTFSRGGVDLAVHSLELQREVRFPSYGGSNLSPAWSPDGANLAFSSSMRGDPEIFVVDSSSGANPRRITSFKGPDVSPVWNPKSGAQIAFVSGRTGLPQIYLMEADGSNVQRMTDTGYAVSPSWSPNGQLLAFAWMRRYGPGAPGGQDIYIMDIATKQWTQLTREGRNDFPSWSPDGRHIVFQSNRSGTDQIWTMLADGNQQRQLTGDGRNTQPNWSWK